LNNPAITTDSVIGISWSDGVSDGDSAVIDYRISYDQSTGNWVTLATGVTDKFYTTTVSLIAGQTYNFKIEARNTVGYSLMSDTLAILVAQEPDQLAVPSTEIVGDYVKITWVTPYDGSSSITGYQVTIRQNDDVTFTEESTNCDGLDSTIVTDHSCSVLISDLIVAPFYLEWGDSVYAKVTAINVIGNSLVSDEGNGAIILTIPDAPTDLANDATVTTSSQIGLTWNEGATNGGAAVIDYTINYGFATGSYTNSIDSITALSNPVTGLTVGVTYKFKV